MDEDEYNEPLTQHTLICRFDLRDSYADIETVKDEILDSLQWLIDGHDAIHNFEWLAPEEDVEY